MPVTSHSIKHKPYVVGNFHARPDIPIINALIKFKWNYTHKKIWEGLDHGADVDSMKVHGWGTIP